MTATEAERKRRRGLTPWWRVRSWSKDLDTLTRLHKSLRALDTDTDTDTKQQPLSAPALLAPPQDGVTGDQVSDPAAPYPPETQPLQTSPDADAETMEKLRLQVVALLNEATRRAYKAVGRPEAALG